jgi:hypothetical protein
LVGHEFRNLGFGLAASAVSGHYRGELSRGEVSQAGTIRNCGELRNCYSAAGETVVPSGRKFSAGDARYRAAKRIGRNSRVPLETAYRYRSTRKVSSSSEKFGEFANSEAFAWRIRSFPLAELIVVRTRTISFRVVRSVETHLARFDPVPRNNVLAVPPIRAQAFPIQAFLRIATSRNAVIAPASIAFSSGDTGRPANLLISISRAHDRRNDAAK